MALAGDPSATHAARRRRLLITTLAVVTTAGAAVGYVVRSTPATSVKLCSADAAIGPDGEEYERSGEHDCRFVDDDGNVVYPSRP